MTNAALNLLGDNLSGREGEGGDSEGLEYVHSILEMMSFDVQATTGGYGNKSLQSSHHLFSIIVTLFTATRHNETRCQLTMNVIMHAVLPDQWQTELLHTIMRNVANDDQ